MTDTTTASNRAIEIGLNARLFPNYWRPAREEIAFARRHGFAVLQFRGPEHGLDAALLGDPVLAVTEALRAAHALAVIEIVVPVDRAGRTASGATPLDALQANLPAICALPCAHAHVHLVPNEDFDDIALDAVEEALTTELVEAVALGREHGFRFGIEHNEPALGLFGTPERCARALSAVPDLGFVWDLNHTIPAHLDGFLALTPRMTMLHVADTPLPAVNYHLPLGLGSMDLTGYCTALLARGFHGPAILEIGGLPRSGGYGRDTDDALIDSRARLQASIDAASATLEASSGETDVPETGTGRQ